jgi:hypothetical protein
MIYINLVWSSKEGLFGEYHRIRHRHQYGDTDNNLKKSHN